MLAKSASCSNLSADSQLLLEIFGSWPPPCVKDETTTITKAIYLMAHMATDQTGIEEAVKMPLYLFIFTFSHLAYALIQSELQ